MASYTSGKSGFGWHKPEKKSEYDINNDNNNTEEATEQKERNTHTESSTTQTKDSSNKDQADNKYDSYANDNNKIA